MPSQCVILCENAHKRYFLRDFWITSPLPSPHHTRLSLRDIQPCFLCTLWLLLRVDFAFLEISAVCCCSHCSGLIEIATSSFTFFLYLIPTRHSSLPLTPFLYFFLFRQRPQRADVLLNIMVNFIMSIPLLAKLLDNPIRCNISSFRLHLCPLSFKAFYGSFMAQIYSLRPQLGPQIGPHKSFFQTLI